MIVKLAFAAAITLAVAVPVSSAFWSSYNDAPDRVIELKGPIADFTRSREHIQIRLAPAGTNETRTSVTIRATDGSDTLSIPLKRGQTWASAKLSNELAAAPGLEIRIE